MTDDELDDMTVDSAIKIIKELQGQLKVWKERFANLTNERDQARRIAAYQYAKHHNGDEDTLVKNFFQFRGWDFHKEDGK